MFPVWDWTKIPGTTNYNSEEVMKENSSQHYFKNNHDFVGGISDGKDGVQAIILNKNDLYAHKSYFFIHDNIVCLGSDIKGKRNYPITTSVTQNLFEGKTEKFEIQGKGIAYHQGDIAYWFPGEQNIKTSNSRSEGNWKRVANFYDNQRIVKDVFNLWIEHGVNPEDAAYCYIIIPAVSEDNYKERVNQQTINILSCTEEVHAIEDKDIAQAVFFFPSSLRFSDKTSLTVDKGCIIMMKKIGKSILLSIAEPTQKETMIEVRINGRWNSEYGEYDKSTKETVLKIPFENKEGKTMEIELSQK
ncbi:MAG: polysaccharide lyase beta-sandwich domain-containing protein [Odoribacter sp.]|nr:polysaccharide lyase beta-sandwich domain-containing protein [Odoribacter sp.]